MKICDFKKALKSQLVQPFAVSKVVKEASLISKFIFVIANFPNHQD